MFKTSTIGPNAAPCRRIVSPRTTFQHNCLNRCDLDRNAPENNAQYTSPTPTRRNCRVASRIFSRICQVEKSHQSDAMSPAVVAACLLTLLCLCCHLATTNPDAKRLYDDLLRKQKYNRLMRPVADHSNNLTVSINLKLSQLIDVVSI